MGNFISDFAFVDPSVLMGDNNTIMEGAIIRQNVVIGNNNYIGPYCIIGEMPEKIGFWDAYKGVKIGNGNRITKQVTIDSGSERKTVIGDNVIMLKNAHAGHDVLIFDNCVISCNVLVGGWCEVGRSCNIGLGAAIHQRIHIPEGCMIGMNSTVTKRSLLNPFRKYAGSPVKDIGENRR